METNRNNKQRMHMEQAIVRKTIEVMVDAGYWLRVHDGEDWANDPTQNVDTTFAAMFACDEEKLYVLKDFEGERKPIGWVFFVYGNSGYDVVCDNTTNLEELMTKVDEFIAEQG